MAGQLALGDPHQTRELVQGQGLVDLQSIAEGITHRAGAVSGGALVHGDSEWRGRLKHGYCRRRGLRMQGWVDRRTGIMTGRSWGLWAIFALACTGSKAEDEDLTVRFDDDGGSGGDAGGDVGGDDAGDDGSDDGSDDAGDVGGEDDAGSTGVTGTVSPECETGLTGSWPESDAVDISILSHILVDFNEPLGDEQLTVFTESGEAVAGSTVVERYGERLRFIPDAPLSSDHSYEVAIEYCEGLIEVLAFRTSSFGAPLACDPSGTTHVFNPGSTTILGPDALADLLGEALSIQIAVTLSEPVDSSIGVRVGGGTTRTQEMCFPTSDVEAAWDSPILELSSVSIVLPYDDGVSLIVDNVSMPSVLDADCNTLEIARVTGDIDPRSNADFMTAVLGTDDPSDFCNFVESFGAECAPCAVDGEAYCIPFEVAQMSSSLAPYALESRTMEDIAADPFCTGVTACSQAAPNRPWAWGALALGLLGVVARRRW